MKKMTSSASSLGVAIGINTAISGLFLLLYKILSKIEINKIFYFSNKNISIENNFDANIFLQILNLAIKIFIPISILNLGILLPIYYTNSIENITDTLDKLTLANLPNDSSKIWSVYVIQYICHIYIMYILWIFYENINKLRSECTEERLNGLLFLEKNNNIQNNEDIDTYFINLYGNKYYNSIQLKITKKIDEHINKLNYYENLINKTSEDKLIRKSFFSLEKIKAVNFYKEKINELRQLIDFENKKLKNSNNNLLIFRNNQSKCFALNCHNRIDGKMTVKNCLMKNDIYYDNLYKNTEYTIYIKILINILVTLLIFFYMIPVGFVQSFANISTLESIGKPITYILEIPFLITLLEGFLPGLVLVIFMSILPSLMRFLSIKENRIQNSSIERGGMNKLYYFNFFNVLLGSIVIGTILNSISNIDYKNIVNSIPTRYLFFISYIMIDGWNSVSAEILQIVGLIIYHIKNKYFVKTEKEKKELNTRSNINYMVLIPKIILYFNISTLFSVCSPLVLIFTNIYFIIALFGYKYQIAKFYLESYQSYGEYWKIIPEKIMYGLYINQILIISILTEKSKYYYILIPLLIGTIVYNILFNKKLSDKFTLYPLEKIKKYNDIDNLDKLKEEYEQNYKNYENKENL